MGHGKETPRQKMIGMMYLVLTALLALNTSKDVLNAFVVVDEGLSKTIENFAEKNEMIYSEFEKAAAQNEKKAGKWRDQANEVKKRSQELYQYIQDLKLEIVMTAEKGNPLAIVNGKLVPMAVQSKDNSDVPAQIMIGSDDSGKANDLRKAIENYKEYLLSLVNEKDESVKAAIKRSMDTEDPPSREGKIEKWQNEHFQHLPLIGVTTIMSGLQANVRNAESDIIKYLYTRIDAGSFKFNKLEATVIHNSNYVLVGNEYIARVFMAAFDTTQKPEIFVGAYDSTKNEDGSYSYVPKGAGQTLDVVNGMGIYKVKGSKPGVTKWGGLIKLKAPEGGVDIMKPFKAEYQVAEASLVVSPTKMNVFYIGVDNPVEISVPGIPADKIFPTITNGTIRKDGKGYVVNPSRPGQFAQISVMAEIEKNQKRSMGMKEFRVKTVPDPIAKVGGLKGGPIDKAVMQVQSGVIAEMENFDFDIQFKVTEFNLSTTQSGFVIEKFSKSNRFTPEQMDIIKRANKNQKIYIETIKAVGPDGTPRPLSTISLTLK